MGKGEAKEFKLRVPWGHIAAKSWGDKSDRRVLMVHGIMDNIGSFERLVPLLPDNFYYVAIDLPGHGWSTHMPPGIILNFYDYVLTIKYVLDELQWEHTYYIGHSLGGLLGSAFAQVYPGRIKKLVHLDAFISRFFTNEELIHRIRSQQNTVAEANKVNNPPVYTKEEVMHTLVSRRMCSLRTKAAEALFERAVTKVGDDAYTYNRDVRARIPIAPMRNYDQCMYFLKLWNVETLMIFVDSTLPTINESRAEMCKVFDDMNCVNIVRVKGNHDVHNNYPERVSEHICKFLTHVPSKL